MELGLTPRFAGFNQSIVTWGPRKTLSAAEENKTIPLPLIVGEGLFDICTGILSR